MDFNVFKNAKFDDIPTQKEFDMFKQRLDFLIKEFQEYQRLIESDVDDDRYFNAQGRIEAELRRLTKSIRKNIIEIAQDYFNY